MKVKDIMTQNPIVIPITTPITKIEEIFERNKIWTVFIGNSEKYLGVITRKDLKLRGRNKSSSTPASAIMTKNPYSIDQDADVKDAINMLYTKKINGLMVVKNSKPCGVITRYDIKTRYVNVNDPKIPSITEPSTNSSEEPNEKAKRREIIKTTKLLDKSLKDQDIDEAYLYATDLFDITDGNIKTLVEEIITQLEARIENNISDIPDEMIRKIKFLSHKIEMNY